MTDASSSVSSAAAPTSRKPPWSSAATLSERKGVNVPDVVLPLSAMTEKDRRDLEFGLTLGIDWLALSFVQRVEDILEVRKIVRRRASASSRSSKSPRRSEASMRSSKKPTP